MMFSSKVENSQQPSFRRKPESRHFEVLRKHWIPVFTGMMTFDEVVKYEDTLRQISPYLPFGCIFVQQVESLLEAVVVDQAV